jgi:hypothetical protein
VCLLLHHINGKKKGIVMDGSRHNIQISHACPHLQITAIVINLYGHPSRRNLHHSCHDVKVTLFVYMNNFTIIKNIGADRTFQNQFVLYCHTPFKTISSNRPCQTWFPYHAHPRLLKIQRRSMQSESCLPNHHGNYLEDERETKSHFAQ